MSSIAATETGELSGKRPNWATVLKSRRARMNYSAETVRLKLAGSAPAELELVSGEGLLVPARVKITLK